MAALAETRSLRPPAWVRWAAVAAWLGFIFVMSAQSESGEQSGTVVRLIFEITRMPMEPTAMEAAHHMLRKTAHFVEFGVLAALVWWALPWRDWRRSAVGWGAAVVVAASDEFHQAFVPNRGPSIADVGIDAAGAAFALSVILLIRVLRR